MNTAVAVGPELLRCESGARRFAPALVTAPSSHRLGAWLVDLGFDIAAVAGWMGLGHIAFTMIPSAGVAMAVVFAFVTLPLGLWATQIYLLSTTGQTLGKRWLGIKIVRTDGGDVGFVQGWLMRNGICRVLEVLFGLMPFFIPIYFVANIAMLATEHRRMLHDRIAGTRVVVA